MKPKFTITKKYINMGQRCEPKKCPVALTFRNNGYPDASVGASHVNLTSTLFIKLPEKVIRFRRAFDQGHLVGPITFELDI